MYSKIRDQLKLVKILNVLSGNKISILHHHWTGIYEIHWKCVENYQLELKYFSSQKFHFLLLSRQLEDVVDYERIKKNILNIVFSPDIANFFIVKGQKNFSWGGFSKFRNLLIHFFFITPTLLTFFGSDRWNCH